jgi:hypothetical protein
MVCGKSGFHVGSRVGKKKMQLPENHILQCVAGKLKSLSLRQFTVHLDPA